MRRLFSVAVAALPLVGCGERPGAPEPIAPASFQVAPCPHPAVRSSDDDLDDLREGRFADLARALHERQQAFEASVLCESELFDAYEALADATADWIEPALDRFVDATPDDHAAHSLRGHWWVEEGWRRRGGKLASETREEQFRRMKEAFERAAPDLTRAIELNEKHLPAYNRLIMLLEPTGRDRAGAAVFARGIEVEPRSYRLRRTRINYLKPRWGGSHRAMEELADSAQAYAEESPKLRWLLGFAEADRGSRARRRDDHREAVKYYTRALRHHRRDTWLEARGDSYEELEEWEAALRDYDERIERHGEGVFSLRHRGRVLHRLGRNEEALRALDRAIAFAPDDYQVRVDRAWVNRRLDRHQEAIRDLRAALELEPDRSWALNELGWLFAYEVRRPREALPLFRRLTELEPDVPRHWRHLGDVLHDLGLPGSRAALERYLELVDPDDPAEREMVPKVRAHLAGEAG